MIHYVGAVSSAYNNTVYFKKQYRGASAHYFVDENSTIWRCVNDEDIATKLNSVINQVQNEIARFKKIDAYKQMEVTAGQTINLTDIDINIYICYSNASSKLFHSLQGSC